MTRTLDSIWVMTVTFVAVATLVTMCLATSGLQFWSALVGLTAGSVAAVLAGWQTRQDKCDTGEERHWFWRYAVCICFVLFSLRAFLWLVFLKGDQVAVLSANNLGDLPLHIQYIRFFSQGAPLWPVNPIHAHSTIGYPFGVDYFNAILDVCGVPLWQALLCSGLIGAGITGVALWRWGGAFTMAGFLFNGGMAGLAIFTTGEWGDYQQAVDWKSLPLALFVTQRGFLYALPAGLLLLFHWRKMQTPHSEKILPFWLEALIYATMPIFHLHTFLFLSLIVGTQAVFGQRHCHFWVLIASALLPASGFIYLLTDGFRAAGNFGWLPGWMQGPAFSWTYWWQNFGLLPVVLVLTVGWLAFQRRKTPLLFVSSALFLFAATLLFKFSPWAWDNTKLMMWSYLLFLPFLWEELARYTQLLVRGAICVALFFSGFLSLWAGLGKKEAGYEIADQHTVLAVGQAISRMPILDVFAAAPDYAHPLVLNGRRLALGYHGHMIGHGLSYLTEKKAMDRLMNGGPDWEQTALELGVRYIYWGTSEQQMWPESEKPWITSGTLIASGDWGEIYRVPNKLPEGY